jgi:hypothetical protein
LTERFYSGRRDGQMTVRDGIAAANKRPLPPRAVLFKHGEKGLTRIGDGTPVQTFQTQHMLDLGAF